ncbi:MAG: Hsp20/alpha crystallin family protein [Candidatus Promineifilaceae bacterium]|nr:Hsp20/alpha crystallin family protein [Candidatus Promineifilaceae bacterium]
MSGEDDERSTQSLREEMNRLFQDFYRAFELTAGEGGAMGTFNPSVNVSEGEDGYEATIELPGMDEEDIELILGRNSLTIRGEKREDREDEGKSFYRRERSYGYFERTIPLPTEGIDRDNVTATFDRGVLTVTLPRREQEATERRQIEVQMS